MQNFFGYSFENPWFFTNYSFLLILGVFLIIYAALYNTGTARKTYLILFSLFFYYKSSGPYLIIFILLILCDYHFARAIERYENRILKRVLLICSILLSLSFLLYFKYSGFLIENINQLFATGLRADKLFLPIGISFYTFQSISYIVDVHQGKIKSSRSFLDYAFYMTFFPHLVAGPIVRAKDFIPQINLPQALDHWKMKQAFFRILTGLSKKLIIADFLGKYIDMVHVQPGLYSGVENLISMYAYSCQIYFDFSGYSDIAIGIALLLGYELKENFANPYKAQNITEFWRRWHISLSSWLRDYIYIPLGGSRKGIGRTCLYLFITMTIGGFWHGASWNFVIWGIAHGIALIVHKISFGKQKVDNQRQAPFPLRFLNTLLTFHFVSVCWILFRSQSFANTGESFRKLFGNYRLTEFLGFCQARSEIVYMLLLALFILFMDKSVKQSLEKSFCHLPVFIIVLLMLVFFQLILQVRSTEIAPFIYFQF